MLAASGLGAHIGCMMRRSIIAGALAAALAASPALADGDKAPDAPLGAELDAAVQDALRALDRFFETFPGYEAPEVTPEGDIIIRRKRPPPKDEAPIAEDQRRT